MIVSTNETICMWSAVNETTECSDLTNGMYNMATIKKIAGWESKFPAFKWCNDFNKGSISGWYLPARDELNDLCANYTKVNTILMNCGVMQIAADTYWNSSEDTSNYSWCQNFANGYQYLNTMYYPYRVRAVRAF